MEFLPPDFQKFPLLTLAYECQETGGSATCTLNAADEIAVDAFCRGIGYPAIHEIVAETLAKMPVQWPRSVGDVLEIDRESRALARELTVARSSAMTV